MEVAGESRTSRTGLKLTLAPRLPKSHVEPRLCVASSVASNSVTKQEGSSSCDASRGGDAQQRTVTQLKRAREASR
eukprot:7391164-Prymnesium_polylepis.2